MFPLHQKEKNSLHSYRLRMDLFQVEMRARGMYPREGMRVREVKRREETRKRV